MPIRYVICIFINKQVDIYSLAKLQFIKKIDKKNKYDINSWVRIRKFSFLISALKELSLPYKLIVVAYLLLNIGFCLDPRFVEAIKICFLTGGLFKRKNI